MVLDFDPNSVDVATGHFIGGAFLDLTGEEIPVLRPSDHSEYLRQKGLWINCAG